MKTSTIRYFSFLIPILFVFSICTNAQSTLFQKIYGGSGIDQCLTMDKTLDDGFILGGITDSYGAGSDDFLVIKTDGQGNVLWSKTIGTSSFDRVQAIKTSPEGNYVVAGRSMGFGGFGIWDMFLVKLDGNGNSLWQKYFPGNDHDEIWDMNVLQNGDIVCTGYTTTFGVGGTKDFFFLKLDSLGNVLSFKGIGGLSDDERCESIIQTQDEGFIMTGFGTFTNDLHIVKLDANGNLQWIKKYGNSFTYDRGWRVRETQSGKFIVVGETDLFGQRGILFLITDSQGNVLSTKIFSAQNGEAGGFGLEIIDPNNFLITGHIDVNSAGKQLFLMKTDSLGSIKFFNVYGSSYGERGRDIEILSNGDFIVAGWSNYTTFGFGDDVYLLKTDSTGHSICEFNSYDPIISTSSNFPTYTYSVFITDLSSQNLVSQNLQITDININESNTCLIIPVELINFKGIEDNGKIILEWETGTETNNYGFELERSDDVSPTYQNIGFIKGKGTTTKKISYRFIDENLESGNYKYRLKQIDYDGQYEYSEEIEVNLSIPTGFNLFQNYPNPFNPSTKIEFSIPEMQKVTLKVFDILGNEIKTLVNEIKSPGYYEVSFNSDNLSSGNYFYTLQAGENFLIKKMVLAK